LPQEREAAVEHLQARLEKLLTDAEDCTLISKLATDKQKRDLFNKIATDLRKMAREVEAVIASRRMEEDGSEKSG
jgi:hypothetical protein